MGDAFLTVACHLSDNRVLLGSTDAPLCIIYLAAGRITASGKLIDIIKKDTIVKLSSGASALVMGITQDKFGSKSIERALLDHSTNSRRKVEACLRVQSNHLE